MNIGDFYENVKSKKPKIGLKLNQITILKWNKKLYEDRLGWNTIPNYNGDRIDQINRRNQGYSSKFWKSWSWSLSVDFFLVDRRNLDLKLAVDVEMSLGIKIFWFTRITLECFPISKNISIYMAIWAKPFDRHLIHDQRLWRNVSDANHYR